MKQQILLFVGADRVYKTTLAHIVAHELGNDKFYYKNSAEHNTFKSHQDKFLMDLLYADPRLLDYLTQSGNSIVMDRGWCDEYVYAKFFKRKTDINAILSLDTAYAKLGAKIIFCTRRSFKGVSDDMHAKLTDVGLQQINKIYEEFVHITKCQVLRVFTDEMVIKCSDEERLAGRYETIVEDKQREIVKTIMEFVK